MEEVRNGLGELVTTFESSEPFPLATDTQAEIEAHISGILRCLGYDTENQHFDRTPARAAKVLQAFHANGNEAELKAILDVSFSDEHDSLVQVGPIKVVSMCAHHLLPVTGKAWVGYLPKGKVCGLSKLARVVHHFAKQLTVQERVTDQVADALVKYLDPKGAMVVIRAAHGCMSLRGVEEPNALTATSAVRGVFRDEPDARAEFLSLMREGA